MDTRTESGSAKGHDYGEWITVTHTTCTEEGEERRYCAACSNYESRALSPAGHVTKETRVEATCTEEGYIITQCTTCNTTIPAKGHTGGEATCTARAVCEVCNESYGEYVEHVQYKLAAKEPTCTEDGYTERAWCEVCEKTLVEAQKIPALGHDYGEWIITSPAGCTEEGVEEQSCSRCGLRKEKSIPAKGHNEETETKEATCIEEGYITTDCTVCGVQLYQEILPKLGHTGGEATCTARAVCEVCNEPYGEPAAHETEEEIISPTCTEKGYILRSCKHCDFSERVSETDALGHEFEKYISDNNATCTEDGTETAKCTRCDETDTRTAVPRRLSVLGAMKPTQER